MSSLSTSALLGMFHNNVNHTGTNAPPMRDICITSNSGIVSGLSKIKANGARAIWAFGGSSNGFKDANSDFSMAMFEAKIDNAFAQIGAAQMHAFVDDGTVVACLVNDDIEPGSVYPRGVSLASVDAQAQYVKSKWSRLPVCARVRCGYLKTFGSTYTWLDFGWSQWRHSRGPVATFYQNEVNDARSVGLSTVAGFNILNGGSGRTAPWNEKPDLQGSTNWGMSPVEITACFQAYSQMTTMIGIYGWTHDNPHPNGGNTPTYYYEKTSIQTTLQAGANLVAGRVMGPLNFKTSVQTSAETVTGEWAYIGGGANKRNEDPASQTPVLPTGFAANNMLGALAYSRDASIRSAVQPSGWSTAASVSGNSAQGGQLTLFYKVAAGGDSDPTITWSGTGGVEGSCIAKAFAFSGNSTLQPTLLGTVGSDSSWPAGSSSMGPVKGITPADSGSLVLICAARTNDFGNGDPPPTDTMSATTADSETWTRAFIVTNGSGMDSGLFMDYAFVTGTPSITSKSWTQESGAGSGTSGAGCGFMVAFKPTAVTAGTAPAITRLESITMSVASTLSFTPEVTGSTPITWSKDTAPSNSTLNSSTGNFQWSPLATGVYTIGLKATNSTGSDIETFTATIVPTANVAPVVTKPDDASLRAGDTYSVLVVATDADSDPLTYELDPGTAPEGAVMNLLTGAITWTPDGEQNGTHQFIAIVSDGQHESRSTWTVTVGDTPWTRIPPASTGPRFTRL